MKWEIFLYIIRDRGEGEVNNPGPPEGCKVSDHLKEANIDYSLWTKEGGGVSRTSQEQVKCATTRQNSERIFYREKYVIYTGLLRVVCTGVLFEEWYLGSVKIFQLVKNLLCQYQQMSTCQDSVLSDFRFLKTFVYTLLL